METPVGGVGRRGFLGLSLAVVGSIFVPQYGRWTRQGSGVLVAERGVGMMYVDPEIQKILVKVYKDLRVKMFPTLQPLSNIYTRPTHMIGVYYGR